MQSFTPRIVSNMSDPEEDREEYRAQHRALFHHDPPDDPNEKCQHPMHAQIRRAMNDAKVEVPFDGATILSVDSEFELARKQRYGIVFQATKEFQAEVEEEDRWQRAKDAGIILPGR